MRWWEEEKNDGVVGLRGEGNIGILMAGRTDVCRYDWIVHDGERCFVSFAWASLVPQHIFLII